MNSNDYLAQLASRWPAKIKPVVRQTQAPAVPVADPDQFLRLDEAARLAGVCKKTLAAWEARGLPLRRIGRVVLVRRGDLLTFIAGVAEG